MTGALVNMLSCLITMMKAMAPVFQIDKEAVIEADVATFKVHHVAHLESPQVLLGRRCLRWLQATPPDYVRKSGDDMTGALSDIRPPKNSTGLRIYAPRRDAGAGQADATQLIRVANSHNQYVFYVEESGAIAGKKGCCLRRIGTVSKKYVDELIAAELTAPARFEWKVYVNADGTPQARFSESQRRQASDTSVIRLHKRAQNAPCQSKATAPG